MGSVTIPHTKTSFTSRFRSGWVNTAKRKKKIVNNGRKVTLDYMSRNNPPKRYGLICKSRNNLKLFYNSVSRSFSKYGKLQQAFEKM